MYPNLNDQAFRLYKINEIIDYFIAEIRERELMSKWLNKYIAAFDYFDKSLIFLSATSSGVSIASFASIIGAPVGKVRASFSFAFSLTTGITKKILKTTECKLNSIEKVISKVLIENEISQEYFTTMKKEMMKKETIVN